MNGESTSSPTMATFISHSPQETEAFAAEWARRARKGDVIGLIGDLGSGKTCWVRGFVRALDCAQRVHSPTFALVHHYVGGHLPVYHLDFYRLKDRQDIESAGLEPYLLHPEGISLIEWFDRWFDSEAPPFVHSLPRLKTLRIEAPDVTQRHFHYDDIGA